MNKTDFTNIVKDAVSDMLDSMKARRGSPDAFWNPIIFFLPNILGFLLGCAVMRICGGDAYFAAAVLGSLALGIYDSMVVRKMAILPAFIRNATIILLVGAFFGVVILIEK